MEEPQAVDYTPTNARRTSGRKRDDGDEHLQGGRRGGRANQEVSPGGVQRPGSAREAPRVNAPGRRGGLHGEGKVRVIGEPPTVAIGSAQVAGGLLDDVGAAAI